MKQFDRGKKVSNELDDFTTTPRMRFHLSREYAMDPLEVLFVRQVMRRSVLTLQQGSNLQGLLQIVDQAGSTQRLFPVIDARGSLIGVLPRKDLRNIEGRAVTLAEVIRRQAVTAFPDEPLRVVVYRMAETGFTQMPVVERQDSRKVGNYFTRGFATGQSSGP